MVSKKTRYSKEQFINEVTLIFDDNIIELKRYLIAKNIPQPLRRRIVEFVERNEHGVQLLVEERW